MVPCINKTESDKQVTSFTCPTSISQVIPFAQNLLNPLSGDSEPPSMAATAPPAARFSRTPSLNPKLTSLVMPPTLLMSFSPSLWKSHSIPRSKRIRPIITVRSVTEDGKSNGGKSQFDPDSATEIGIEPAAARATEREERKRSERRTYLVAAMMSSLGISSMAVLFLYYRFSWQMEGGEVPYAETFGTLALSVGAAVGMEYWARWAHRALWHASLWHMHESHHKPREGPFELNDVFAIVNAVPAIALLSFGFFRKGLIPGLCFGAGLGITVFGMAYMFVHDGLVHRRFPVGPVANVPYFRRVAAAHQVHHSDKFNGVPYGLFLGPKELEEVGGLDELEKEIDRRIKLSKSTS